MLARIAKPAHCGYPFHDLTEGHAARATLPGGGERPSRFLGLQARSLELTQNFFEAGRCAQLLLDRASIRLLQQTLARTTAAPMGRLENQYSGTVRWGRQFGRHGSLLRHNVEYLHGSSRALLGAAERR